MVNILARSQDQLCKTPIRQTTLITVNTEGEEHTFKSTHISLLPCIGFPCNSTFINLQIHGIYEMCVFWNTVTSSELDKVGVASKSPGKSEPLALLY
jgi:hypothetical protein